MSVVMGRDPTFEDIDLYIIHYYFPKRSKYKEELSSLLRTLAEENSNILNIWFTDKTHKAYYTATIRFVIGSECFNRMKFVEETDTLLKRHLLQISNNRCKRNVDIFKMEPERTDERFRRRQ